MNRQTATSTNRKRILFVCLGNICRSPAAEGIFKAIVRSNGTQDRYEADSAGIGGWHVGDLPDSRMRRHGAQHGYTFDSLARQFHRDDFGRFDLIVGMDHENIKALKAMASSTEEASKIALMADYLENHSSATIPDPYYGTDKDFEHVIELLEDACGNLYRTLEKK